MDSRFKRPKVLYISSNGLINIGIGERATLPPPDFYTHPKNVVESSIFTCEFIKNFNSGGEIPHLPTPPHIYLSIRHTTQSF